MIHTEVFTQVCNEVVLVSKSDLCFILKSDISYIQIDNLVYLWTTTTQALSHVVSKRPVRGALVSYIRRGIISFLSL